MHCGCNDNEYYIFTFGYGQQNAGKYVKVYGSYAEARQKMFEKYGSEWAFQYSIYEWENWLESKPSFIPTETFLEEF